MNENKKIAIFQKKEIRKIIHNGEWWLVINDVITALTDSKNPAQYFKRIKTRDDELRKLTEEGGVQFVPPLRLDIETAGGKQKMYCWNLEGVFRLIQSVPSPKAEPFKRWLAKVGFERVQEIEDPELARSVDITPAISPTASVESFRQYFGTFIKQLADKYQLGINNNQIKTSGFQVR